MGIKNLIKIITKFSPEAINYRKIGDYRGKNLGIDANLMIYKIVFAIRKGGYDIKHNGIKVTHIHAMMQKLLGFRKYKITPVFVFDGFHPEIKEETMQQRKEFREHMKELYDKAVTQDEKKKYFYIKSGIKLDEIRDIKKLITLFGYKVIDAVEEADSQLAHMSKTGLIDGIITDDMDILVFGGRTILKNFTVSDKKFIQEISLPVMLKKLKISQNQLIDIAILLGCDYCPTIKGVGPMTAYKLIRENGSLERVIEKGLLDIPIDYKKAKRYFKNPQVEDVNKKDLVSRGVDHDGLVKFLEDFGYTNKKLDQLLDNILKSKS